MNQDSPPSRDHQRILLGVGVLLLAVAAVVTWAQGQPETGSVLLRSCILLAAVWLAYPALRSTRWGVILAVAGGAILLLTRWRLVAGVILAALGVALLWGRIKRRGSTPN